MNEEITVVLLAKGAYDVLRSLEKAGLLTITNNPDNLSREEVEELSLMSKIQAIKEIRTRSSMGLKEAKDWYEGEFPKLLAEHAREEVLRAYEERKP